jgi:hypothetical protein
VAFFVKKGCDGLASPVREIPQQVTFGFIKVDKASFPISLLWRVLEISQSGVFAAQE